MKGQNRNFEFQGQSNLSSVPTCRQFWKAGNYETVHGQSQRGNSNHLHVHPSFLHSNATSHKWVFGAIAELLDNAFDEIRNGATFVDVNIISNPRDGSPTLLIQDDGAGMDPQAIRQCMSFGFSKKEKCSIGQYGNGFKTSTMRLGADVIVFSRHKKERIPTQCIGLLSYTFLRQMGYERIVVPLVDYEFNPSTRTSKPILHYGEGCFSSNITLLSEWSPYKTEEELLMQFNDVGESGTKVIIYNLWLDDCGKTELDFDSDPEDIWIRECPKFHTNGFVKPHCSQQIADTFHYSLRVYLSILYLRLPECFKIMLRGRFVDAHNIADDLKYIQFVEYKPYQSRGDKTAVYTTIGFLKKAPHVKIHGFNIYHRNRLILPYRRLLKSRCKGVVGILEANHIEPTHNKQDFEKTSLFQKLEDRLKHMAVEYWRLHCHLIGCQNQVEKSPPIECFQESPSPRIHRSPKQSVLPDDSWYEIEILEAAPDVLVAQDLVGRTANTLGYGAKRKEYHHIDEECPQHAASNTLDHTEQQFNNRTEKPVIHQEAIIRQKNRSLRIQLSELDKSVERLEMQEQQCRAELDEINRENEMLLAESMDEITIFEERFGHDVAAILSSFRFHNFENTSSYT